MVRYVLGLALALCLSTQARAGLIVTGTPEESWRYSTLMGAPHSSINYYPTSTGEYAGATFQDYVTHDFDINGRVAWFGDGPSQSFHIFTTYVLSSVDQTFTILLGGDDGHSLFIDDIFATGGGFDAEVTHSLSLTAGVARKIEIAGYNAPGPWVFVFEAPDNNPIETVPGVRINADGNFAVVPEPSNFVLAIIGAGFCGLVCLKRRAR